MLTRRPSLTTDSIGQISRPTDTTLKTSDTLRSCRILHPKNGVTGGVVQASSESHRTNRASLAYVRSLSIKEFKAPHLTKDSATRSATDATRRLHMIPYSELILKRKLDGGLSLIEASECGAESFCWEEAWKVYMQSQTASLKELSARMQECSPGISTGASSTTGRPPDLESCSKHTAAQTASTSVKTESHLDTQVKEVGSLRKLRDKKLNMRRTRSLVLLNILAGLYGSSTVAGKFAMDAAPGLPASLSSLVRFSSALLIFLPAVFNVIGRDKNLALMKAGAELGGLLFAATVLETGGNGGASSDAPLLFAFTVIFVTIMELCAGRQSVRNITRVASLVALSGMGILEEEGFGWKGVSLPQVGNVWGLAASAIYALHIFRSEAHSSKFKPFELTGIQCGTVASLSLLWEISRVLHDNSAAKEYMSHLGSLPLGPLVYTGLVCTGLCSWLEIRGLRSVHASTTTMINTTIPIWGALLSFLLRGQTLDAPAIVGGSVILAASLFAQIVSKQGDNDASKSRPVSALQNSTFMVSHLPVGHGLKDVSKLNPTPSPVKPADDHVQGAIISSQLKFPYYAAQAKRLLLEAKLKLLSVKSLVMSATSSLLINTPPVPSDSLHSASTAIATSVSLQQSASSFQLPVTGNHAVMVVQWLDVAAGVLESAITTLGSDVMQALEEAEDLATLMEQVVQKAMEQVAMVTSAAESILSLDVINWISETANLDTTKSVDGTTGMGVNAFNGALPLLAHHADTILQFLSTCPRNA